MAKDTFTDVRYYISLTLRQEQRVQLGKVLDAAGATEVKVDDSSLTHFITNSLPNDDTLECLPEDTTARLVTPTWVVRSRVLDAPQPAEFYSPDPAQIFSGVIATATDLSPSDSELMYASITALGGQWRSALTRDVTHMFALAPGSQKYETAMHYREQTGMLVLVPHWHDDSIRLGVRGLPTAEYEWPEPAVFKGDWSTSKGGAAPGDVPKPYKIAGEKKPFFETALAAGNDLPVTRAPPHDIWKGLRVLLGASLGLSESQRSAHEEDIRREGGTIIELDTTKEGKALLEDEAQKVEEADVFVTTYRSGPGFVKAYKENKTIGTLSWLWYCRATGSISHPTDQLIHYPIPRKPVEGFSSHSITITNYTGKHRDYLKKLILTMGASFTPSMSPKNTVVVAAYISGTKAEKATSWSIPVVNHTWLEDCFVQWRSLTPAQDRYINFPPRMDFSELITERPMGGKVLLEPAELDALAKEGLDDEQGPDMGAKPKAGKENKPPLGTAANAREMREVEDAILTADDPAEVSMGEFLETDIRVEKDTRRKQTDADDDLMDVDEGPSEKPRSTGSSPRKYQSMAKTLRRRGAARVDDAGGDGARPSTSASPDQRRTKSKRMTLATDEDSDVEMADESPLRGKTKKSISRMAPKGKQALPAGAKSKKATPKAAPSEPSDDEAAMDIDRPKTRSVAVTRKKGNSDAQLKKTGPPKSARKRTALPTSSESEAEAKGSPPKTRPVRAAAELSRSAVSESMEPDSPHKPTRSSRKEVTVLVPTVTAAYKAPPEAGPSSLEKRPLSKMDSVRAAATELSASPGKRSRTVREKTSTETPEALPSPPMPKSRRKAAAVATPEARTGPANVETPSTLQRTPSRRAAASKATRRLRDEIMPDVVNFQRQLKSGAVRGAWEGDMSAAKGKEKEKERTGEDGVAKQMAGGEKNRGKKRVSIGDVEEAPSTDEEKPEKKRQRTGVGNVKATGRAKTQRRQSGKSARGEEDEQASETDGVRSRTKPTSKGKDTDDSSSRSQVIRVMTTQITVSDEVAKFLKKLGVQMTTKPSECTHLVARNLVRTEKFLSAMAHAPYILSEKWLLASYSVKELLPEDKFVLKDPANESKFGFKLTDALRRAKMHAGKLFAGHTFYVTPRVPVDTKLLKNVVVGCGGQLLTQTPTVRILAGHDDRHVVSAPEDRSIWRPLAQAGHRIYNQELILTSALKQEIDWENETYILAGDS